MDRAKAEFLFGLVPTWADRDDADDRVRPMRSPLRTQAGEDLHPVDIEDGPPSWHGPCD